MPLFPEFNMGTKNVVISAPLLQPTPSKGGDHRPRKLVLPVKKKQLTLIMNSKINGKYYHGVLATTKENFLMWLIEQRIAVLGAKNLGGAWFFMAPSAQDPENVNWAKLYYLGNMQRKVPLEKRNGTECLTDFFSIYMYFGGGLGSNKMSVWVSHCLHETQITYVAAIIC